MDALSSDAITKIYRGGPGKRPVQALSSLSLTVAGGEIFSLLGPNGAGKTTFLKILLSLTHPTSGSATILGRTLPNREVRGRVGYLPENHRYPAYLTGEQVLMLFGRLAGVQRSVLAKRVTALLHTVGMEEWKKVKVKRYSKGMMQRLGLAQALTNDPDVLFLDEPTDGVDPVGRKEIRDVLRDLRASGKTIFLNSHLLSEVELVSDRVAILDKGRLLRVGTVEELTSTGQSYLVSFEGALPEAFRPEAEARVLKLTVSGQTLTVEAGSTAELNALIDLLRAHGVQITSVLKQRATLEESFIDLLRRGGAA